MFRWGYVYIEKVIHRANLKRHNRVCILLSKHTHLSTNESARSVIEASIPKLGKLKSDNKVQTYLLSVEVLDKSYHFFEMTVTS